MSINPNIKNFDNSLKQIWYFLLIKKTRGMINHFFANILHDKT